MRDLYTEIQTTGSITVIGHTTHIFDIFLVSLCVTFLSSAAYYHKHTHTHQQILHTITHSHHELNNSDQTFTFFLFQITVSGGEKEDEK